MIRFYDINEQYINFLKSFEPKVPDIKYDTLNKFVCGIVLHINDINYVAPISSKTQLQKTCFPIYDKGTIISTIKFSFMFPAKFDVLLAKDFKAISSDNLSYSNLLQTEYQFCRKHEADIYKKAEKVYKIGCNKNHYLNSVCCDFKKLEDVFRDFNLQEVSLSETTI